MITLRLDPILEQTVNSVAQQLGISKSELIHKSIAEFLDRFEKPSPWELGKDIFGFYGSEMGNLSSDRKRLTKEIINVKR